ncbi:hypothetical protein BH11PSE11_BH11PSE11_28350 [soil metagenome]
MNIQNFDAARDAIEACGFTPRLQTKISLFLTAAKNANAAFLGAIQLKAFGNVADQYVHRQHFQEMEAVVLLAKVTQWAPDPMLFFEANRFTTPIWAGWQSFAGKQITPEEHTRNMYRGLALGHALLAQIRLTPIIPGNCDEMAPYVVALRQIEQDNANKIQTQIQLLRAVSGSLPKEEAEAIVEEKQAMVSEVFTEFLLWLER